MPDAYRSPELGDRKEVALSQGSVLYCERGSGQPIVFLHGLMVNANLWRKVVPLLADRYRCIAPDLPLGSHGLAMNADADLSPPAIAGLIADFLDALKLEGATLVANDTGGALAQMVATEHPKRVARLVLTNCDAYENFPPAMFRPLLWEARVPGALRAIALALKLRPLRRLPFAFGWLTKRPIEDEILDSYLGPALDAPGVMRDLRKALIAINPRYTKAAAEKLPAFDKPVLIAWAPEDRFFPWKHAERLRDTFANARLESVADCRTFVPEDQPQRLAELIAGFIDETTKAPDAPDKKLEGAAT
jgi:pimeloyl-ACP methyl ester carboxylesterase